MKVKLHKRSNMGYTVRDTTYSRMEVGRATNKLQGMAMDVYGKEIIKTHRL